MRTIVKALTPQERLAERLRGERRAARCMIGLVAVVSMLRTLLTRVLTLAGAAGRWVAALCIVQGLVV